MKTIREHLNSLPPLFRDLAIYECERLRPEALDETSVSLCAAISWMFIWDESEVGQSFWETLCYWTREWICEAVKIHSKEKTAASQAILEEHKAHFTASTRAVLIAMLKGQTLDKHSGISSNISSRCSDLIRENGVPIVKTKKLRSNGKLAYFQYSIAEADRAALIERFKLKL